MHVGENIRARRTAKGLSQEALARATGLSLSTIVRAEAGTTGLRLEGAAAIAAALDSTVDELIGVTVAAAEGGEAQ